MRQKYNRYLFTFKAFIGRFLKDINIKAEGDIVVAVSGGADSMALLYIMSLLNKEGLGESLRALHVNHGTRQECLEEEKIVQDFCNKLGIPLAIKKLNIGQMKKSNFEKVARDFRYEFFQSQCNKEDYILTAHHLDDSFEWSFMQQMKSSKYETTLGIPVLHNNLLRPFLCVTRKQIRRLIKEEGIPFLEDASNQNTSFERNYIRKHIIPHLKIKYPKYLKHYAYRHNQLAKKLRLSLLTTDLYEKKMKLYKLGTHIHIIYNPDFKNTFLGDISILAHSIEELATSSRGKISKEVLKLKDAFESSKRGPMSFSGGVKVFIYKGALLFISNQGYKNCLDLDEKYLNYMQNNELINENKRFDDLYNDFFSQTHLSPEVFLQIGKLPEKTKLNSLKSPSLLFPKTTKWLIKHGVWHQNAFTCLSELNKLDSLKSRN